MSSTHETGHYKNVAEFGRLVHAVDFINGYNPTSTDLQPANLQNILSTASSLMDDLKQAEAAYKAAVQVRTTAFDDMQPVATRIYNSLVAANSQSPLLPAAKAHIDKLRGERAKKLPKTGEQPATVPNTISVSQRSYDARLDHLKSLLSTVMAEPAYRPNETEVSVAGITRLVQSLDTLNNNAAHADAALSRLREKRQALFYANPGGLVATALAVKAYLKGAFGTQSQELKEVSDMHFTNPS